MSQTEEEFTAIILHQRRNDQSEQQRDDVVNVVYVPGVDMSVLEGQRAELQVAYLRSVQLDLVRDRLAL